MALINVADLTFNGKEVMALSEAIYESVFSKPEISLFHTIKSGIKARTQIAILGRLGLIGKKATACNPADDTNTITNSEKFWTPEDVRVRFGECWEDLKESFWYWGTANGIAKDDLTRTDFAKFVVERLDDALFESVLRVAWFNDTSAATVDNSPGTLTSGTTLTYFNIINGLWQQIFAIVTADSNRRYTITENANATYATQLALASDRAYQTFKNLVEGADKRLKGDSNKVIICTDSLWDNWLSYKESQSMDRSFERQAVGFETDVFRGIPIIKFDFWDRYIQEYYDDGAAYYRPHRALLVNPENLQLGVEDAGTLSEVDVFHDKVTEKTYFRAMYSLDAKVILDYAIQAAY